LICVQQLEPKISANFFKAQERIAGRKAMSISGRGSSRDGARDEETKKERKSAAKLPFSRRVHVSTRRRQWERSHGPSGIRKLGLRLPALNNMPVLFIYLFSFFIFSRSLFYPPPTPLNQISTTFLGFYLCGVNGKIYFSQKNKMGSGTNLPTYFERRGLWVEALIIIAPI